MINQKLALMAIPVLATVLIGSSFAPAFAGSNGAYSETINTKTPIDITIFVPCANDGLGEDVHLEGTLHSLFHVTSNNNGSTISSLDNPQRVSGYGLDSGDLFQGTGVTRDNIHVDKVENSMFVNNFRIIGQGPGNNFLVHTISHFTLNANGDLTADVHLDSIECK